VSLIVEDGTGVIGAESFVSVADYRAYLAKWGVSLADADADCEVQLRRGTRDLCGTYRAQWPGRKEFWQASLDWPRVYAFDVNDLPILPGTIPQEVKDAECELAYRSKSVALAPDLVRGGRIHSIKVGPVEKVFEAGAPGVVLRPEIRQILSRILVPANRWREDGQGYGGYLRVGEGGSL
jgi:hypothetical protein